MKFCVMMAAQRNTILDAQGMLGKEDGRQDVVGLQHFSTSATAAGLVARPYRFGPLLPSPAVPESLSGPPIHIVGIIRTGVPFRELPGLRLFALACPGTRRTVAGPVFVNHVGRAADLACSQLGVEARYRLVDRVQNLFVLPRCSDVPTQISGCLRVRSERKTRL